MSTVKANTIEPASGGTVTISGASLVTPAIGTPASGTLTNCTGLPGSGVVNTPSGGISATTVQAALNELDNEKFDKSGGTISGNVGVGAAPSSWGSYSAVDIGGSGAIAASFSGSTATQIVNGAYYNGTNWIYKYTGVGTARYELSDSSGGVHRWFIAPSGTAGNAISFTQAMTLDASGNLGIGVTPSAWGSGNRGSLEIGPSYRSLALTGDSPAEGRVMQNAYYNGTNWIYSASYGASGYRQSQGSHAWFTAPSGTAGNAISFTQAMTLDTSSNLLVGATSGNHHTLSKDNSSNYATTVINTSATSPYGQRILLSGVTGGGGAAFLSCQDNTERLAILGNGNVQNINNSYGAISDAKLKRDVTDTGPKLPKVLAMRIVNYYLKADQSNTKLLGMIAQELREISPGLVEETPDFEDVVVEPARTDHIPRQRQKTEARTVTQWQVEVRDGVAVRTSAEVTEQVPLFVDLPLVGEDGQPIMEGGQQVVHRQPVMEDYTETVDVPAKIERRATGTVTLSVKYSILVPMLVKAMQELHADFDTRLKALEARA